MLNKEEVVGGHRYFAKIGNDFFRVKTARKPFAKASGNVRCRKSFSDEGKIYYVSLEDLYNAVPQEEMDIIRKREEAYREKERKIREQRLPPTKEQCDMAIQEFKKNHPDLRWVFPELSEEWKNKVIDFIKKQKIKNTLEEIEAIFRMGTEDPYFPRGSTEVYAITSEINKHDYMNENLYYDVAEWIEEETDKFIYENNKVLDEIYDDPVLCELINYMGCYYDLPQLGLVFDRDGFISDVMDLVDLDEWHEAILYAKEH